MAIIQDIVPITDTLARWAVAENMAAQQGDSASVLATWNITPMRF